MSANAKTFAYNLAVEHLDSFHLFWTAPFTVSPCPQPVFYDGRTAFQTTRVKVKTPDIWPDKDPIKP